MPDLSDIALQLRDIVFLPSCFKKRQARRLDAVANPRLGLWELPSFGLHKHRQPFLRFSTSPFQDAAQATAALASVQQLKPQIRGIELQSQGMVSAAALSQAIHARLQPAVPIV